MARIGLLLAISAPLLALNYLGTADSLGAAGWQRDSESLVLAKVQEQAFQTDTSPWGLLIATPDQLAPYEDLLAEEEGNSNFRPYLSQIGVAGHFFSWAYDLPACDSVACLRALSGSLTALAFVLLTVGLARISQPLLAYIFFVVAITSPWLVAAAPNLYWIPWSWILPTLAAILLTMWSARPRLRIVAAIALFAAFALRFAAGYEFITTITLMAASVPILSLILARGRFFGDLRRALRFCALIIGLALGSFALVLLGHSALRGRGDISAGIRDIYVNDVLRRTYGASDSFPEVYARSLDAHPLLVLAKYLLDWDTDLQSFDLGTPLTVHLPGSAFWILVIAVMAIVLRRWHASHQKTSRDAWLLGISFAISASWYFLAKGHSYIHTHINFVLWYLPFVPVLWFIVIDFLSEGRRRLVRTPGETSPANDYR
ncbi:hypothetical protein GCM10009792_22240 [Microcella alkalica]